MTEAGQSPHPEAPGSPRVPPPNRPAADDRRESGNWTPPPARPRPAPARPASTTSGTAPGKGITFTLQKSTLASLSSGLLVLGVLIFIGGFLSGVRFMLSRQPAQTESPAPPKASSAPPSQTTPQASPEAPPPAAETADNLAIEPPVPVLLQPALKAGDKPTLAPASVTVRVNPLTGPLPPPPPSDRNQRLFTLQAGAFLDKADADRVSAELQGRDYPVKVLKTVDAGQREWFRVRIGQYTTLEQATAAAQAFQEKEHIPVEVVRQPAGPPQK